MDSAKIRLSTEEMRLVENGDWILTKNAIIRKVYALFGELAGEMKALWPEAVPAKISKGENYRGLPYVVLDYPRLFSRQDVLAVRTMFWWGHYFSITLHVKGKYKDLYVPAMERNIALLSENDFQLAVSTDEWEHELSEDHYLSLRSMEDDDRRRRVARNNFVKLSAAVPLAGWNTSDQLLLQLFTVLLKSWQT